MLLWVCVLKPAAASYESPAGHGCSHVRTRQVRPAHGESRHGDKDASHPFFHRLVPAANALSADMRKLLLVSTALVSLAAAPVALAAPEPPPTDPIHVEGGGGCPPDYPCTPRPISVEVDKTYPSRVVAWVKRL